MDFYILNLPVSKNSISRKSLLTTVPLKGKQILFLLVFKLCISWALVADAYNPSYLGGRDQEDHSSKPAWANSLQNPFSKNSSQKRGLVEWVQGIDHEFKPQY
jgi:hypothetical protein